MVVGGGKGDVSVLVAFGEEESEKLCFSC